MLRQEIQRLMFCPPIARATLYERVDKLLEEVREYMEVYLDPLSTIDELADEAADIGIVCRTIEEIPRRVMEELGFNYDALMIAKIDRAVRKHGGKT